MGHRTLSYKNEPQTPTEETSNFVRNEKGSLFIEFIFFLPIIILIWTILVFTYYGKKTSVNIQAEVRTEAWDEAMGGSCGGTPMNDGPFRGKSSGSQSTVTSAFAAAAMNYKNAHGSYFSKDKEKEFSRPAVLGGSTTARGDFTVACAEDSPKKWTTIEVVSYICVVHGVSQWCI